MKRIYIKPQIVERNTRIKNYLLTASDNTSKNVHADWTDMLTKDRNNGDIWNSSDSEEESIW